MEVMIHGKYVNQGEDLSEVLAVRKAVFGADAGADDSDPQAVNLLVSLVEHVEETGTIIGCGRLNLDMEHFRFVIDYLGIEEAYRKKGYGEFALRALVDKVNQCGADRVFIRTQDLKTPEAEHFFTRMFFQPDEEGLLSAKIDSFHTCSH